MNKYKKEKLHKNRKLKGKSNNRSICMQDNNKISGVTSSSGKFDFKHVAKSNRCCEKLLDATTHAQKQRYKTYIYMI